MEAFKKLISILLRIGISIILLALLFLTQKVDTHSLLENIRHTNKNILLLAFLVYFLPYALCFCRWKMLLDAARVHLSLRRIITSFSGGIFFSLFLPSTIGGDVMRSLDLAAHTKKPREVVATVLLDRLSGYCGMVALILLTFVLGWIFNQYRPILIFLIQDKSVKSCVAIITLILIALLAILFNSFLFSRVNRLLGVKKAGKIGESLRSLHEEIYIFKNHKSVLINNILISLFIQMFTPLAFYLVALAMGVPYSIIYFFIFLPIIGAITLLPISMGGLGVRENMSVFLFTKIGMDHNSALAMSLIVSFFILIYGAIGGLIYVLTIHRRRIQPHQPSTISP